MKHQLISLFRKHEQIISYVFFGGLTTLVNFIVYYPLYNLCHLSASLSNILAWIVAVIFAYLTNKPFVVRRQPLRLRPFGNDHHPHYRGYPAVERQSVEDHRQRPGCDPQLYNQQILRVSKEMI